MKCVINTIITLEENVATDDSPGLWGFAFKWILLDYRKKISPSEDDKIRLLDDMERRLKSLETNAVLIEHAVSLLAEYYAAEKDEEAYARAGDLIIQNTCAC